LARLVAKRVRYGGGIPACLGKPDTHYTLSSLHRLPQVAQLIAQQGYFIIHAPRQVGKTTTMLTLAQ
jgi:hypothetical protein